MLPINKLIIRNVCIGMGICESDNHPFIFDAVNEKGLAGAGLNFIAFAHFSDEPQEGKTNISGSDFVYWALSNFTDLTELKEALKTLKLPTVFHLNQASQLLDSTGFLRIYQEKVLW